jgi:hypothetical protein
MRRLSSNATFFYKRILLPIWLGFLLIFIAVLLFAALTSGRLPSLPLLIGAPASVLAYFIMRMLVSDLVDEVLDAGDALIVRNGDQEERIALSEIVNINYFWLGNMPLRSRCRCEGRAFLEPR